MHPAVWTRTARIHHSPLESLIRSDTPKLHMVLSPVIPECSPFLGEKLTESAGEHFMWLHEVTDPRETIEASPVERHTRPEVPQLP